MANMYNLCKFIIFSNLIYKLIIRHSKKEYLLVNILLRKIQKKYYLKIKLKKNIESVFLL